MTYSEGSRDLTESIIAATEAARIASLMFNAPVFGESRHDLTIDYGAWLEKMNSPELSLADKRTVWEQYGTVFVENSMSCSPTYPILDQCPSRTD